MRRLIFGVLVVAVLVPNNAVAGQDLTGNDYLAMTEDQRAHWVKGYLDGGMAVLSALSVTLGMDYDRLEAVAHGDAEGDCSAELSQWTVRQHRAVLERWLQDNPELWHQSITSRLVALWWERCSE
jgi:hypothetical protein